MTRFQVGAPGEKRRILVVTRNLPPLRGGMERLNLHLLHELSAGYEVRACCPRESLPMLPPGVQGSGSRLRPLPLFMASSGYQAITIARRFRPHLVLAGSGLTAPIALAAAAAARGKAMAYLHGLDIAAEHWAYRNLWVPRFRSLDMVLVNSRHTANLASRAGISDEKIGVVHPGTTLPQWNPPAAAAFRRRFSLEGRPLLLALGRLTARKGLVEFIEAALPPLVRSVPDLAVVVIGGEAINSLKKNGQSQCRRLQEAIVRLGLENHVKLLGEQEDAVVDAAFFAARALVFPVLDLPGDVEGFGMVAIEAAAHGVPTVAFAVGGVVDAVSDPDTGSLIRAGDYATMTGRLLALCQAAEETEAARLERRKFAETFEWSRFGQQVRTWCDHALAVPTAPGVVG